MRWRISIRKGGHLILWTGLLVTFLFLSGPIIFRDLTVKSMGPPQPFHSSDAYLQAVTGLPHSSQRFIDLLTDLSLQKPILIFVRESDATGSLLGLSVAYLAWPREVQIITIPGSDCADQLAKLRPASVAALVFCELTPPSWIPSGTRLGPHGRFVKLSSNGVTP
jgi:hypothetical protein